MPYKDPVVQTIYWREHGRKRRAAGYTRLPRYSTNPSQYLWMSAKGNAKIEGRDFTITPEDIVIPEFCPLLGTVLTRTFGVGRVDTNISIDRIDNSKGYIPGNIWVISDLANRMKRDASISQLQAFAAGILINFGGLK